MKNKTQISNLAKFKKAAIENTSAIKGGNKREMTWECEDDCLKSKGGEYCGETDHL